MARSRKYFYGFNSAKDSSGQSHGQTTLKITIKNAYELMGLRKPAAGTLGKP